MKQHSIKKDDLEEDQIDLANANPRFLTSHARVLLLISAQPEFITRELAKSLGMTERATQRIISQLIAAGYLLRSRTSKHNHYEVNHDRPVWKGVSEQRTVADLIEFARLPTRPGASESA